MPRPYYALKQTRITVVFELITSSTQTLY